MTPLKTIFLLTVLSLLMSVMTTNTTKTIKPWDCSPEEISRSCDGKVCTLRCSDGQELTVNLQCEEERVIVNEDNKVFCSPDPQDADNEAKFLPGPAVCLSPLILIQTS